MKKYLFATIILGFNLSFAEDTADFKKSLIASCIASENSQTACKCWVNGIEKELTPKAWEAFMTLINSLSKGITYEGSEAEKEDLLAILDLEVTDEQMMKITTDCNVKTPIVIH